MPVKIRLQRHGKKGKPFYWIVAADVRAKRDGKFLEKLGIYNPNTNPATVEVNIDSALQWLENGAQPTNTARTLLSYRGVMLKYHLQGGVRKGAFSQEEAEKKFDAWLEEKNAKIQAKVDGLSQKEADERTARLAAEKEANEKRKAAALEALAEAQTENAEQASDAETQESDTPNVADEAEAANETPAENTPVDEVPVEEADTAVAEEEAAPAPKAEDETAEETTAKETPETQQDQAEEAPDKEA